MNSTSKPEEKSKVNEITDLKMKKNLRISRAILIVGIITISICALSYFWVYIMVNFPLYLPMTFTILIGGIILGIIISVCGLYGLKVNKSKLDRQKRKSKLDRQKRKIRRKFISGLTVLILGIILIILAGYLWWHYIAYGYMMGGMSGLILYGAVGLTIWSTILMIPGLIQLISYRKIRKEQNKKSNSLSME